MLRRRLYLALAVFAITFVVAIFRQAIMGEGDFSYAVCEAHAILAGSDPYAACPLLYNGQIGTSYPLTSAFVIIAAYPFGLFAIPGLLGLASGVLTYGLLKEGEWWKLLLFLSPPFLESLWVFQWSPLIATAYLVPAFLPLALAKPTIGLPVILMRLTRWRFILLLAIVLFSLILDPRWPVQWLQTARTYDGYVPVLWLPFGPTLLLSALKWKDERARFLFLMTLVPQRGVYELVPLFLLPNTRKGMLFLFTASYLGVFLWGYWHEAALFIYFAAFYLVAVRPLLHTFKSETSAGLGAPSAS